MSVTVSIGRGTALTLGGLAGLSVGLVAVHAVDQGRSSELHSNVGIGVAALGGLAALRCGSALSSGFALGVAAAGVYELSRAVRDSGTR